MKDGAPLRKLNKTLVFLSAVTGETETLKVDEWKSVDLKTEVTDIKRDDLIEWRFGFRETLIAEINPANNIFSTYDGDDGLFRDKLNLNHKTGDLTIKSITWKHNGDYILKIIRDGETSYRRFRVSFYNTQLNVGEGKSVDLKTEVKDIKRDDLIEWTFGKTIIAKINPVNNIFNTYKGGDDLFKYKLKLNPQTGDLNIKEIRQKHTGVYILKIIRDGKTSDKRFFVSIKDNVETLQVDEEKSVTLKTEVTDIQRVDLIEWRFGETLIAKINPANNIFRKFYGDYGEFRYKLKVNHQTGDLNINDIRWQQDGVYLLKIIRDGETSYKRFSVSVRFAILKVDEGESVNLKAEVKNIKRDDVIEWRFKETLIAQINPVNNIFSTYDGDDDLFRDKLKLNHQTGDLNINDIRLEHTGVYELKITRDGETSDRRLFVSVTEKTKELKVNKGKSVDLKTEVKDIKRGDLIEWRFRKNLIAQINPANKSPITYDDAFRGKLKLKPQTGDLTINDIREEHSGVYLLKITRGGKISYMRFKVSVMDNLETLEVDEGKSVDLKAEVNIHYVDLIEWRFEKTLIAEINPANKIFSTYDGDDDEFRDKLKLNHQTGDLNISDIRWEHDGVYKLKIIRGGKPSYRSFEVIVRSSRGEDSVEKRGGDSVEKRGGDSVGIEMDPLLNNSSQ
ncbi:uncharacterized protein [Paramisgurnus dabryanus]|uniref:uncharacterized protein n=1 Tax=Paramisgurnus dabryanus TaxID=90735 RepID=UPI003CCF559A